MKNPGPPPGWKKPSAGGMKHESHAIDPGANITKKVSDGWGFQGYIYGSKENEFKNSQELFKQRDSKRRSEDYTSG